MSNKNLEENFYNSTTYIFSIIYLMISLFLCFKNRIFYVLPNYFYVVGQHRENRFNYRKSNLIKQGFDPNKTEHEIMLERNIYRIYDCGTMVFKLNL